jgi:hypothetical protein
MMTLIFDFPIDRREVHEIIAKEWRGVPLGMKRMNPERLDSDPSDLSLAVTILLREEPEDEEEEEDEEQRDGGEENDDGDEGYSE